MLLIGTEETIECVAERGQPLGQFVWKIGEDEEVLGGSGDAIVLESASEVEVEEDDDGYFTATQVKNSHKVKIQSADIDVNKRRFRSECL